MVISPGSPACGLANEQRGTQAGIFSAERLESNGLDSSLLGAQVRQHGDGCPGGKKPGECVAHVDENHRDVDLGDDRRQVKQQWLREMVAVQHGQPIADRIDPNFGQHQVQKRFTAHHLDRNARPGGRLANQSGGALTDVGATRHREDDPRL